MRKLLVGGLLSAVGVLGVAGPAMAHDCFNPNKTPGAGSKTTVVLASNPDDETLDVITTGKGNGGFVHLDTSNVALPPGVENPGSIDVHIFGGNKGPGHDGVAGPGEAKAAAQGKGCDGKGIDYIEVCFGP